MLQNQNNRKTSARGLEKGWVRFTAIIEEEVLEKAKDYAYWERLKLKVLINALVKEFLSDKNIKKRPIEERDRTDFIKLAKLDRPSDADLLG